MTVVTLGRTAALRGSKCTKVDSLGVAHGVLLTDLHLEVAKRAVGWGRDHSFVMGPVQVIASVA